MTTGASLNSQGRRAFGNSRPSYMRKRRKNPDGASMPSPARSGGRTSCWRRGGWSGTTAERPEWVVRRSRMSRRTEWSAGSGSCRGELGKAPSPVRPVLIPKKRPGKFRPLGIPSLRDRVAHVGDAGSDAGFRGGPAAGAVQMSAASECRGCGQADPPACCPRAATKWSDADLSSYVGEIPHAELMIGARRERREDSRQGVAGYAGGRGGTGVAARAARTAAWSVCSRFTLRANHTKASTRPGPNRGPEAESSRALRLLAPADGAPRRAASGVRAVFGSLRSPTSRQCAPLPDTRPDRPAPMPCPPGPSATVRANVPLLQVLQVPPAAVPRPPAPVSACRRIPRLPCR